VKRSVAVLALVCGFAVCLPLTEASARHAVGAADRPVTELALKASQVGPGYRARMIPGGRKVQGQVTLDLCGAVYVSETLRTQRIQLVYGHRRSRLGLSNEVVRYYGTGAQRALDELEYVASHCPRKPIESPVLGVGALTWRLTRIRDPRLLPSSVAVQARISGTANGKRFVDLSILVYQVHGNVLSAVYTFGGTIAAQKRFGLRAAALSAENLRTA